jgi:2,3-bisphosphoglycerate-independent phosphoglycerate mutase
MASYSAGHISTEESRAIVMDMATTLDDETFRLYPGVAYRHILVVKGHPELLDLIYAPPHDISDQPVAGRGPSGEGAKLLLDYMKRARLLLGSIAINACRADSGGLPATDVWPFWPGVRPSGMMSLSQRRGVSAALTSGVDLLNGLAVLAGIDRLDIAGVTDGPDTDYAAQARGALDALTDHDLVVIHIESPDEMGHAGNVAGKIEAIEAIDREVISRVRDFDEELRILAMPDHATPIEIKTHVGEPVPFVLWGPGIEANGAPAFDQYAAASTRVLVDPGREVMDRLLGGVS